MPPAFPFDAERKMKCIALAAFIAALVLPGPLAAQSIRIQVIDVGTGDGILIRTPAHEWVLIDAAADNAHLAEALPTNFGVDRLRLAVGSHRHADHIGGMDEVLRAIDTDLYLGDLTDRPTRAFDDHVREAVNEEGIEVRARRTQPDTIFADDGDVLFIVLPPAPRQDEDEENENSIVVRLEYGEFSMLFPGDLEQEAQEWLIENFSDFLDVDVLKAPHHGANNGWSDEWLAAVTPERVVISAGVHGNHRHPQEDAVEAYLEATDNRLYCTNRHGTIRVYGYDDGRVRIYKQRPAVTKGCAYDGTWY